MKIGIDARFWGPGGTGLGRYAKNLVLELQKIDDQNEYYIFLRSENLPLFIPERPNFHPVLLPTHPYSFQSQLADWIKIGSYHLDIMHFTHFSHPVLYPGKFIVSIHDLIKTKFGNKGSHQNTGLKFKLKDIGYQYVMKHAARKAEKIITATNYVKREISQTYGINPDKIATTYYGGPESGLTLRKNSNKNQILEKYHLKKPFLLYVGNAYPYKNVIKLLEAMSLLKENQLNKKSDLVLVLVCSRSVFYDNIREEIKKRELESMVKMLGFVPDEELVVLYSNATAFITASLSEGFGITGIEAMAAGCPVLSSNRSCLPEVYGEAAMYFDPENAQAIIETVFCVLNSLRLQAEMRKKGFERSKQYSWSSMAREVLHLYEEVNTQ